MKQSLLQNRKKEDLLPAGKAVGQTKFSFAKKEQNYWWGKLIISFCTQIISKAIFFQFKSNWRHCMKYAKIRGFSNTYFPVYQQNRIRTFPYMDKIYDIRAKIRMRFCLYMEKYGPEKACYSTYFTQWVP